MMKKNLLFFTFILSLLVHYTILRGRIIPSPSSEQKSLSSHKFKIQQLRLLGIKDGLKQKLLTVTPKNQEKSQTKPEPSLKSLAFTRPPINKFAKKILAKKKATKNFSVKKFLKNPIRDRVTTQEIIGGLNTSELDIKFELPEGVPEDELNKRELVFYSFQKRTVEAYINSFVKELNSFRRKNPRAQFPLTRQKQTLAGRIIYDKNQPEKLK